jgi:hypothetical protein
MEPPDEDLPVIQVSLGEFVLAAEQMFTAPDQLEAFLRFVLAGRLQCHDKHARISINARQGAFAPPISEYKLHRDIDSVIGITRDLPFQSHMAIFPLASFRDSLTEDNHLKCPLSCPKVRGSLSNIFNSNSCIYMLGCHRNPTSQNSQHGPGES